MKLPNKCVDVGKIELSPSDADLKQRLNDVWENHLKQLEGQLNRQIFYVSPEDKAKAEEFNRTYVPPVLTPEQQLWSDYRDNKLDLTALTPCQMVSLLKQANEELDQHENHECW